MSDENYFSLADVNYTGQHTKSGGKTLLVWNSINGDAYEALPSPQGGFGGLSTPNKAPPPKLKYELL